MSRPINIANSFPAALPLPFIDYTGVADPATLHSPPERAVIKRRSTQERVYSTIQVMWKFTRSEYSTFLTWWDTSIGSGTAAFSIELRYPKISDLDTWIVKIIGELDVEPIEHEIWQVQTAFQIISPATVADKADTIPNYFYVLDGSSSGSPYLQFLVQQDSSAGAPPTGVIVL